MADDEVPQRTTIYDVARAAGVSASTVSRAFARPGRVSSSTAARIHEIATDLGYRRDTVFRPTSPSRTRVIGLAVSDITNPFYFGIIRGAERAAATADFTLMVGDAHESAEAERRMLNRHLPLVDGMVITSSRLSDQELRSLARRVPVVVLNRNVTGLPCVVPDNARGIRRAVEHLGALGHSRIGYLAGPEASWADGMRWRAVRESALELGLEDVRIGPIHPTIAGGRGAARKVRQHDLTAVICYNDLLAVGMLRGIRDLGAGVPEDVSVIGFDNTQSAELVGLTTIASPSVLLGETAVLYMVGLVKGTTQSRDALSVLPVRLVNRQSTGPRP